MKILKLILVFILFEHLNLLSAGFISIGYIDKVLRKPEVKAFLDTISFAEGTNYDNGYNVLYGGHLFKKFDDHPRVVIGSKPYAVIKKEKDSLNSSAAGKFQILEKTWDKVLKNIKLRDFKPLNQDRAAVWLLHDEAEALNDVVAGKFEVAVRKSSKVWASFPNAPYGQPTRKMSEMKDFYKERLKHYKSRRA